MTDADPAIQPGGKMPKWHIGLKPGPIIYDENGNQIADCRSPCNHREENLDNAKLIAAVPEMLDILKCLRNGSSVSFIAGDGVRIEGTMMTDELMARAAALLETLPLP